ncbi:MAG: serine/threonine protein phosphatase, partial [Thermofilum sp. ex4484_15]
NVLIRVLGNIKRGYECGVIHGDLSEYNIIIKPEIEELKIIDWPQWVPKGHPEAVNLLRRDIANVINFFRRKYRVKFSEERALELVLGGI